MEKKVNYIPAARPLRHKKVGIYCRVSTNDMEQLNSLTNQISALRDWCLLLMSGNWWIAILILHRQKENHRGVILKEFLVIVKAKSLILSSLKVLAVLGEIQLILCRLCECDERIRCPCDI